MSEIIAQNIDAGYKNHFVLNDISFNVNPGEVLVLLGPNGAGKSTLLNILAGQLSQTKGVVKIDGQDLHSLSSMQRAKRISLTYANQSPSRPVTVWDAVSLGRAPLRGWLKPYTQEDQQIINESISAVGLDALTERKVTELSTGEWQRVIIARALAQSPEVLLIDEPTSHLDPFFQISILQTLKQRVRSKKLGLVVVLHDLNLSSAWADRIVLLAMGKIVTMGTPNEVLTNTHLEYAYKTRFLILNHPKTDRPIVTAEPNVDQ